MRSVVAQGLVQRFALGLLLLGVSAASAAALGSESAAADRADCHRVATERFVLHSDPWINLHHFLYQWARNVPERLAGDHRRAIEVPESDRPAELDPAERRAWERALAFYRNRLVERDLVWSPELRDLKRALTGIACAEAREDGIPGEVGEVVEAVMPIYRRHWWPRHHAHNLEWIESARGLLAGREAAVADDLAEAYGGRWQADRVRVDVTAYASWSGAYTTNHPTHVTISSTTNPHVTGLNAPEMLFHEVSHAWFLEEPLKERLEAAFAARGAEVPDGLSHAVQWVTPAELLRARLGGDERERFEPYAERSGLYRRSRTIGAFRLVLEEHWVPFLVGEVGRAEALDRLAAELTAR